MPQQSNPYPGTGRLTIYQPSLESKSSPAGRAQQPLLRSPSQFPGWHRYVIAEPLPAIEDAPTSNRSSEPSQDAAARSTGNNKPGAPAASVYQIPGLELPKKRFKLIQQWRGTVIDVRESELDAELRDQTDPSHPRETSTFGFDELSEGDERLVKVGAVFYWCIGYQLTESRQRTLVAEIIFRRLPGWSRNEVAAVKRKAAEIEELLGIENLARTAARS